MIVKDFDSFMTCGAVLAQMPKSEKHLSIPCNAGLSSQSHCSHLQTKTGHFFNCMPQTDCRCMHIYYTLLKVCYAAHFPKPF